MNEAFRQPQGNRREQRKVFIKTYGCQMNVYDSQLMEQALAREGFAPTENPAEADLVVLNTCHIREKAAEKVYSELGRVRAIKNGRAKHGKATLEDLFVTVAREPLALEL